MENNSNNMSAIFEKLNDLKNLFRFAEKVVPIIHSITEFMREVVPLLENINYSIEYSTSQMPQASNQITNVTNATELATTEILDITDHISGTLTKSEESMKIVSAKFRESKGYLDSLEALLTNNPEAISMIQKIKENSLENELKVLEEDLSKLKDDNYKITLSLQVQDITAQQLAAVNHLIEAVHTKLASLIQNIDNSYLTSEIKSWDLPADTNVHFDPNASYTHSDEKQNRVDEIFQNKNHITSQEEIDKLFG